ncbi:MAG TPA: cytochrome c [Pseudogracilibacillus sp.]|nr:cytochrome c [Pseudogracilibacillus sp.]
MKKWLMAIMFGAVLVLGACGGGDDGASEEPAEDNAGETVDAGEAEEIYKQSCASCHGGDLEGGAGPALADNSLSQDEIETIVEEGKPGMPGGLVSGDDLTTLAEWLAEQ